MINGKTIGDIHLGNGNQQELTVYGGFSPAGSQQDIDGTTNVFLGRAPGDIADGTLPESTQDNLGAYTVQAGDTLQSIALNVYGDSSLWYLLADANGISDKNATASNASALNIGQRINLPAVSTGQHQTSATHKVLNTTHKLGNISATAAMPPAPPPKKNNLFAVIVVAVICVVATVFTAGVIGAIATGVSGATGLGGLFSLGTSVLGGSTLGMAGTIATGFSAGFVGSLVSQGAATVLGIQDQISMKSALVSGLATAATAGIAKGASMVKFSQKVLDGLDKLSIPKVFNPITAAKAMAQNAANQSINLAISRHQHFAWDELAVAGFTAGVMDSKKAEAIKNQVNPLLSTTDLGTGILSSELSALTNSAANAITGKSFDAKQVLVDNLGSAIGNAFVDWATAKPNFAPVEERESVSPLEINAMCPREDGIEDGAYSPMPTATPFDEGTTYQRLKERYAEYNYRETLLADEPAAKATESVSTKVNNLSGFPAATVENSSFDDYQSIYGSNLLGFIENTPAYDAVKLDGEGAFSSNNYIDYSVLYDKKHKAYRKDQIKSYSYYNKSPGSPIAGDASEEIQRQSIDALIASAKAHGLNLRDTAHVLAIARHESG